MPPDTSNAGLWPYLIDPRHAPPATEEWRRLTALADRLAMLTSPQLTAHLLAAFPELLAGRRLTADRQSANRLMTRFFRQRALQWVSRIAALEIEVVYMKGLATALTLYPDPDLRNMSDIDLLVREADLARFVKAMTAAGFTFRRSRNHAWGLIGDASFKPLVSPDGHTNFDIHVYPDNFPTHLGLSTEEVFAASRPVETGRVELRVPAPDHTLLIALMNVVRDKFHPGAINSLIDAILLIREPPAPDWDGIMARAETGGFVKGLAAAVTLFAALGMPDGKLPPALIREYRGPARLVFDATRQEFARMFPRKPRLIHELLREVLLCAEPRTVWWKNYRRISGLVQPRRGEPVMPAR